MSQVILHVGLHKTGTTMIQNTLARNADRLAAQGIVYPAMGPSSGHHGLAVDWNPHLLAGVRLPGGAVAALAALADEHAASGRTVILSSEELSRADPAFRPDLRAIREALAPFGRIRVVCTLRAQWRFLQSVWLEIAKRRMPGLSPDALMRAAIGTGRAEGLWVDFNALYDHLLETFAPEEITFLDHARASAGPGGLLGAVLELAGGPAPAALDVAEGGRANISGDPLPAWAAASIADPYAAPPEWLAITRRAFREQFGPDAPSTLFTRAEREALTRHFRSLNARLAERVAAVQPGFAVTGDEGEEDLLHRESLGAGFWLRCNRGAFRVMSKPAADRDIAARKAGRG